MVCVWEQVQLLNNTLHLYFDRRYLSISWALSRFLVAFLKLQMQTHPPDTVHLELCPIVAYLWDFKDLVTGVDCVFICISV